jgi:Phage tail lysozyme/Gp5 N-terminal OB domain
MVNFISEAAADAAALLGVPQKPQTPATNTPNAPTASPGQSTGDLPWGVVLMPTTSSGQGGVGNGRHGLQHDSWVFGFYGDGDDKQQPIVVGTIPGGPNGGPVSEPTSSIGENGAPNSSSANPGVSGGQSGSGSVSSSQPNDATSSVAGGDNVEKAFKKLRQLGYSPAQAAGIIGNLQQESGANLSVTALNPNDVGQGRRRGIAQWSDARYNAAINYWKANGVQSAGLEAQIAFIDYEMKNYHPSTTGKALMNLQNAVNDPADAARAFMNYEKPKGWSIALFNKTGSGANPNVDGYQARISNALAVFKKYNGTT